MLIVPVRRAAPASLRLCRLYSVRGEQPEFDYAAAREWRKTFGGRQALRNVGEITYARSSGPGGQHVNKFVEY
jgi:hypothetical protein